MKLKRFIAILLVLMLSWTISYADNEPIDGGKGNETFGSFGYDISDTGISYWM